MAAFLPEIGRPTALPSVHCGGPCFAALTAPRNRFARGLGGQLRLAATVPKFPVPVATPGRRSSLFRPRRSAPSTESRVTPPGDEEPGKKPTVGKLLRLLLPDAYLLGAAFVFLVLAATMQALMPHYLSQTLGAIIDGQSAGVLTYRTFRRPLLSLLLASMGGAIFASIRGAFFIVIGARASVRLRTRLMNSLTEQDIGFFDTTKTGEITSRLTQDCQKSADQVSYNVNIFARTVVGLLVTLCFMLYYSRTLTFISFVTVPVIVLLSKKYGELMQALSEKTQQKLADANAVAEEALSSMSTVRSFAGETSEKARFASTLDEYYHLERHRAKFYIAYLTSTMALPQLGNCVVFLIMGPLPSAGFSGSSL
ncbi:unnamed protein product [Polarella glacialis]|uniref:ABC transmembrane type-1 domain-containing protein n=1 Tax=Polarella glacialis TaxID=89957 RepID=A0A813LM85_POLGL|nr:unnamed protein product [Polarella glacialis]